MINTNSAHDYSSKMLFRSIRRHPPPDRAQRQALHPRRHPPSEGGLDVGTCFT